MLLGCTAYLGYFSRRVGGGTGGCIRFRTSLGLFPYCTDASSPTVVERSVGRLVRIVGTWQERVGGRGCVLEQLGAVQFVESRTDLPRVILSQSACSAALVDGAIDVIWSVGQLTRQWVPGDLEKHR